MANYKFQMYRQLQQNIPNIYAEAKAAAEEIVQASAALATPPQYTALGGGIGIHGGSAPELGEHWTWGCLGLADRDVEELYPYAGRGTPVIITP